MTSSFLKGKRTRYRNLLEKELENGKSLISEAEQEEYEVKIFSKNVRNCLRRSNDFIEKLEQTNERLSVAIEGEMVLMQTAKADVQYPINGLRQIARILLDSGSQRTYITESLAKRLNLKLGDKDEFMLVTFDSEKPKR